MSNKPSILKSITTIVVIGIDLLNISRATTSAHPKCFFYACFMVGCMGAPRGAPSLVNGKVNPVQPATLLIDLNGGSFYKLHENTIMSNNNPVRFVHIPALHLSKSLQVIWDIQSLAKIGEQAIINELPVDASNYDALFASIGQKAHLLIDELDEVFIKSISNLKGDK